MRSQSSASVTSPDRVLLGSQTPRIWTPRDERFDTKGPILGEILEVAGLEFDVWQHLVAGCALEHYPNGRWVHRTVCFVVGRQNGKTRILKARILAGLFVLDEKLILHTAQDRSLPRKMFIKLKNIITEKRAFHRKLARSGIRETNGEEQILLKDGSTYEIRAPRPSAFEGPSADLIIIDEIRRQRDTSLWGSALPSQSAVPNPQIWATSNEGDVDAVQLHALQERGRAAALDPESDRNICYLEWSAHKDRKPADPAGWAEANPTYGVRITAETINEELLSLDADKFETERLCRPGKTRRAPRAIPWVKWEECGGKPSKVEAGLPRPQMGIHIDAERTHAALAMVARRDGRIIGDVVEEWRNPEGINITDITADVLTWMKAYKVREIAYDRAAASVVGEAVAQKGYDAHVVNATEYVVASQNLFDAVTTGQLLHRNNVELNAQVAAAGRRDGREGTWHISQAASDETIPAVLALAFAVNLAYRPVTRGGYRSLQ